MAGERRVVTMLFSDVKGSTSAAEKLDPEEGADIMNDAFEHLISPIYHYEGTLARLMEDAILAFFGAPIAHEDDAERAVLAALEIVEAVRPYKDQVREHWGIDFDVRVGVNTGLVVVGAVGSDLRLEYTAMGDAVNVAARMEQSAEPGTVQIAESTWKQVSQLVEVEGLGGVEVKGKEAPVLSYRVTSARERPHTLRGIEGLSGELVGRDEELGALRASLASTLSGSGRIVSIMAEAGLGKSRLIAELKAGATQAGDLDRLVWLEGHTLSYESSTPYACFRRVLQQLLDADNWTDLLAEVTGYRATDAADLTPFLASVLGIELPADQQERVRYLPPVQLSTEVARATSALLEGVAARRPVFLVLEDLHWADSASIDLVVALLTLTERAAVSLVTAFRPRKQERSWQIHEAATRDLGHRYTPVELRPLDAAQSRQLIASLLAIDDLPDHTRSAILDKAEGNPFFIEEVLRSLIDQGIVFRQDDRWCAKDEVGGLEVPQSLAAVLNARLDLLPERPRALLQSASVIGREFRYDELEAIAPQVADADDDLRQLERRAMIRELSRLPQLVYQFNHVLMQEAAYDTLLLKRRKQLHADLAAMLEQRSPERAEEIAQHFTRAQLPDQARPHLLAAGGRALNAYAVPEALRHFQDALDTLPSELPASADRVPEMQLRQALEGLGQAQQQTFDAPAAVATFSRLAEEGERLGDEAMRLSGMNKLALLEGAFLAKRDEALARLAQSESLARAGNQAEGLIESCITQCYLRTGAAEFDLVEKYMAELKQLGDELGIEQPTLFGMTHLANTLAFLTRFDEAVEQGMQALRRAEEVGHLKYQAELLTFPIPVAHANLGNGVDADADAALQRGMEISRRIGDRASEMFAAIWQAKAAMASGAVGQSLELTRCAIEAAELSGMPHHKALSASAMGTCYREIGGSLVARAVEYHEQALELAGDSGGVGYGAWLWAETGMCKLEAGRHDEAADLLDMALNTPTAPMHLMRPLALAGKCRVALAEGALDEAARLANEVAVGAEGRLSQFGHTAAALQAQVAIACGDQAAALAALDGWPERLADGGASMARVDLLASRAATLRAFDRADEAGVADEERAAVCEKFAAGVDDPDV